MQNAQSVTAQLDEIYTFLNDKKPRLFCLSETHLIENIDDLEINVNNYSLARLDSLRRSTGGVLFYIRNDIKYSIDKQFG